MSIEELKFTKEHEWIKIEGDLAIVGISDYAQDSLGDVVFVDLPELGRTLEANEVFAVIESVKAVSDVYSPCSGSVAAINEKLLDCPEIINQDPYGEGWLIKLEKIDLPGDLMSAAEYQKMLEEAE